MQTFLDPNDVTAPPVADSESLFLCEFDDHKMHVSARDSREAWARFCDTIKKWPSPKKGKVTPIE